MYRIGILQLTQHLDDAVRGFKTGLADHGVEAAFIYRNADSNLALLPSLAREIADGGADIIFACSTPAARAAVDLPAAIPVIYTPVFDPIGAGLAATLDKPGGKATGMAGFVPPAAKIAFMRSLLPETVNLGLLYHAADPNALLEADLFRAAAAGIYRTTDLAISRPDHLSTIDQYLTPPLDAIFLPIGRIIEENFATIAYYADLAGIPVIASSPANIAAGALAGLVADHEKLGCACASQAAQILNGADPAVIPVGTVQNPDIILNIATAAALGITLPDSLLARAREIYS